MILIHQLKKNVLLIREKYHGNLLRITSTNQVFRVK